jgi:hypothetical protein
VAKKRARLQAIGIDILGVLMLIGVVLFGWLPGPGGIPLLIGGLSLLAINHTWAQKLLTQVKERGGTILEVIFRDHPIIKLLFDVASVVFACFAIWLLYNFTGNLLRSAAIILLAVALFIFLANRKRLQTFTKKVKGEKTSQH